MSPQQLQEFVVDTPDTLIYLGLGIVLAADIHLEVADIHFEAVDIHFEAADKYPLVGSHPVTVDMTAAEMAAEVAADIPVVDMPDNHLEFMK